MIFGVVLVDGSTTDTVEPLAVTLVEGARSGSADIICNLSLRSGAAALVLERVLEHKFTVFS